MKLKVAQYVLFISLLYGLSSSELFLSHQKEVKQEDETLSIICKDSSGEAVSWIGPKHRKLGEKTHPQVKMTMYGTRLIFNKIRKEDAGTYTCRTPLEAANFNLEVEGPIDFVDTPSTQSGKEGTDIVIRCEAKGGEIFWLIDGEPITDNTRYQKLLDGLLVRNATKDDAKVFTCRAMNLATGSVKDKSIKLQVIHRPRFPPDTPETHYEKENVVYGHIGGIVNLTCEVLAEPPPTFSWYSSSRKPVIGEQINESIAPGSHRSVLMIMMKPSALQTYKCIARNEHGSLEVGFRLKNGSLPNPPTYMKLVGSGLHSLTLEIDGPETTEEENETSMAPQEYKVEYRPENGSEWLAQSFPLTRDKTYNLTSLEHSTSYEVRAATRNLVGISAFVDPLIFQTESNSVAIRASYTLSILLVVINGCLITTFYGQH